MTTMPPPPPAPGPPVTPEEEFVRRSPRLPVLGAIGLMAIGAIAAVAIARSRGHQPGRATLKSGWTSHTVAAGGFSIGLPPNWTSISTTSAGDAYEALRAANPQLANLVKDQLGLTASSLIKLLAFDVRSPTIALGVPTSMNVVVAPIAGGVDLDVFLAQNLAELRRTPGITGTIGTQRVMLPAGEFALVSSHLSANGPGGAQEIAISQYLTVSQTRGYIVSFSTLPSYLNKYTDLFQEIARTMRFR